ncbi:MAG TPA: AAA family ATPase [Candidatus Bathyarchaeia archaeon]|nr:AAA family ATPase [Candidatus Bathyarchaeia archaeon]
MKLRSFRVQNYRCIDDSGEAPVEHIKALVGKNESGKTSILRALHKFNPASPEPYNGLKEFPRRRFHEYEDKAPVVELKFSLDPEDRNVLSEIDQRLAEVSGASVKKDYAGRYAVELLPDIQIPSPNLKGIFPLLIQLRGAIDRLDDTVSGREGGVRWKLLDALTRVGTGIGEETDLSIASSSREAFVRQVQEIQTLVGKSPDEGSQKVIGDIVRLILNTIDWASIDSRINKYIVERLPVFVYFENYAILSGRIHLPSFAERFRAGLLSPEENTASMLLSFLRLDPEKLVKLGTRDGKSSQEMQDAFDTRALMVDRAALSVSGLLADIWQQRKARLDLAIDGDYLRLWVADAVDGSRVELEQSSKGFQWFLSFYIVFMTETLEGRDTVLLLDEPGLHLHAAAQQDLLRVLARLSEKNLVIYSTHSPFMIDLDALDTIGVLAETPRGTKISEPTKTTDKTALFPLQAALGYALSRGLYTGEYSLLVENITDLWILSTISQHFKEKHHGYIADDIVITPSGGGQKSALFATMLAGQNMSVSVLLDSDVEGISVKKQLVESPIARETNVIFVNDASQEPGRVMEVEDLLPPSLYLKFVNDAYSRELGKTRLGNEALAKDVPVRRYVEAELKKREIGFSRFRVARQIMNDFPNIPFSQLPAEFVQNMERLFSFINRIKPEHTPQPIIAASPRQSSLRAIFSRSRS